ncbi:MAG: endonuclease/exonuclease/phosphatase family protein [Bacteroidetes bacterium]|nr:endonuclease/exonuclease/phosphatase family protein [Fibrella sp.]
MNNQPNLNARAPSPTRRRWLFWLRLLTGGLLTATLVGYLGNVFFLFELFSHFAVQYAVLAALLLVGGLYLRSGWLITMSSLSLLLNGLIVSPWLTVAESGSARQRDLRVLHANVLYDDTDTASIMRLVRSQAPDIFVLQEMTFGSIQGVSALKTTYPYQYHIWSKGPCRILVGSRTPIRPDSALARPTRVVSLKTTVRGRELVLLSVHPQTPTLPSMFADRNQQLAFVADNARRQRLPTLLVGDLNISVFSPVYRRIFQPFFVSSRLTACRRGFGLQPTWPRFLPPMFIPIDHAFVNEGFRTVDFRTIDQPGSDHKAVVVDVSFADAPVRS